MVVAVSRCAMRQGMETSKSARSSFPTTQSHVLRNPVLPSNVITHQINFTCGQCLT